MSTVVLDEVIQESELVVSGHVYDLVQVMPALLLDGVLVNYVVVDRERGSYDHVAASLPEARQVYEAFEKYAVDDGRAAPSTISVEQCH